MWGFVCLVVWFLWDGSSLELTVDQADSEFRHPLASASRVLGIKGMPLYQLGLSSFFYFVLCALVFA